ncbi:hypothetical protein KC19_VG152000 [Ceratodon purpureus]|uniref:Uncharacterized protein n=2 Tax=Ceratodon purpureus TaxID=3225 RepID=A0A8T0HQT0_CERPU|nr:hypothetical protein KC19_VG152000 [Ceratodon purpureus]
MLERSPVIQEESVAAHVDSSLLGLGSAALMSKKPRVPENFNNLLTKPRLKALKQYIGSFQYRLNSQTNFNAHKLRPLAQIMDTARMIVYAPQPIKCVEAVFVALYLTAGLPDVERVPLGFKTELSGQVYQHIVLLVQHGSKWGAFGISRCPDLMNKDLMFDSMSSVIENFKAAYELQGHIVLKVRVGLPVEHSNTSPNFVCWRHLNLNLRYTSWSDCVDEIDNHAARGKRLWDLWILSGKGEDPHKSSAIRKAPLDTKEKMKKLSSRDAIVTSEASSSSELNTSSGVCSLSIINAGTSKLEEETTTVVAEPEAESTLKCLETTLVAPCPGTVGNSKFRSRTKIGQPSSSSAETGDAAKGTKLMRAATMLPRSIAGIIIDQMLTVSRGFLRKKYFQGTAGNGGKRMSRPKTLPSSRQMVVVGTNPLFTRKPIHISHQTPNAETLVRKSQR